MSVRLTAAILALGVSVAGIVGWAGSGGGVDAAALRPVKRIYMKYEFVNGFNPSAITVIKGTKIVWKNQDTLDQVSHTVTKRATSGGVGAFFDSDRIEPGATYERVFNALGTVRYVCLFHDHMRATITVVKP